MNKVKTSAVALTTSIFLMAASAPSFALDRQVENALIKVCKSTLSDKPIRLKNAMDDYNLKMRNVALNVMCNGDDIVAFAEKNGSHKIADRLHNSVGKVKITDVAKLSKINVNFE
ncbi:DUF3718 domain-containing protein [Thalassotalea atypica]|uniref:DUF3718 domain-containing protein n=1 Tax=Thalassotalea atypica TaxID=2054316 RepID=UPI0025730DB8|nr:DUF3718 domain-containing protein [Thalassotalea atypica]